MQARVALKTLSIVKVFSKESELLRQIIKTKMKAKKSVGKISRIKSEPEKVASKSLL